MVGEQLHWYITDRCNLECGYCFKPQFSDKTNESRNISLAHIVAGSDITKVTLGGGEPTLVRNLAEITHILKQSGKYVCLHTNGLSLDDDLISELEVDDIALPLDSLDRETQNELRGKKFLRTLENLTYLAQIIGERCIRLGYHTVFTAINDQHIPEIYNLIKMNGFDYWRIYEFNEDLALTTAFGAGMDQKKLTSRIEKINKLAGSGTSIKGYTDCLFAKFLLMEQQFKKKDDGRI